MIWVAYDLIPDGIRKSLPQEMKMNKLDRIQEIIKYEHIKDRKPSHYDCLDEEKRRLYKVEEESGISENPYHVPALQMIERHKDGLVLDVGAGKRNTYYSNVVNLDIMAYDTTDVISVGECLPFRDNVFDAIHSNAVLEHVKDPTTCAKEMMRVLKPGGELMCCVPFLQPFHACPHHYYNMTSEGLKNLFPEIQLLAVDVYEELRPITSLKLLATDYINALDGQDREEFLSLTIRDIVNLPYSYLRDKGFVVSLSKDSNFKMACCHTLFGVKSVHEQTYLHIKNATYGANHQKSDVTNILRMRIKNQHLVVTTQESIVRLFGDDPAPGHFKELIVEWQKLRRDGASISQGVSICNESCGRLRTPLIL